MSIQKFAIPTGSPFNFLVHPAAQPVMAGTLYDGVSYIFFGLPDEIEEVDESNRLQIKGIALRSGEDPSEDADSHWGYLFSWIDLEGHDWHIHLDVTEQVRQAKAQVEAAAEEQARMEAQAKILVPNGVMPQPRPL